MSTTIRSEVSKKNPYWIERHRYFELKHFCMQYRIWKQAAAALLNAQSSQPTIDAFKNSGVSNPTERAVLARDTYIRKIELVEKAASKIDSGLRQYVLRGVCNGTSYEAMRAKEQIPYCRETYYTAYRKFFSELNKIRD